MFISNIDLDDNLRMIYNGNRFNFTPDFNAKLYNSWYTSK